MPATITHNTSSMNNLLNDYLMMTANTGLPEPYARDEKLNSPLDSKKFEDYATEMESLLKKDPSKFVKLF